MLRVGDGEHVGDTVGTRKQHEGAGTARHRTVREYLYIEQLAELTPWSEAPSA